MMHGGQKNIKPQLPFGFLYRKLR